MDAMSDEQFFKYDVAFSFCQEDEPQAIALSDLIQDCRDLPLTVAL